MSTELYRVAVKHDGMTTGRKKCEMMTVTVAPR